MPALINRQDIIVTKRSHLQGSTLSVGSIGLIHNTSFSLYLKKGSNKLEFFTFKAFQA